MTLERQPNQSTLANLASTGRRAGTATGWSPRFDIAEDSGRFVLYADLPGLAESAIQIRVEDSTLTLSGERDADLQNYTRRERPHGKFERRFRLPENVDDEAISAAYGNGVLVITLPKGEPEDHSRVISVH